MRITSSAEYAMRILIFLAKNDAGAPYTAEKIAVGENVPRDYVNQLLMKLRQGGLVLSKRGATGGHKIARSAAKISVGDVFRAVGHPAFEDSCEKYSEGVSKCMHQDECGIRGVWTKLGGMIEGYLNSVTLADLETENSPFASVLNRK